MHFTYSYNSWYIILLSALFWSIFYLLVRVTFPERSPEWCNRIVTLFHGTSMALIALPECGSNLFDYPNEKSTEKQLAILVLSLGYFLFDSIWSSWYQSETKLMLFHHWFTTIAMWRVLGKGVSGAQATCAIGGMEVTNPFLQFRWFLRTDGYQNTKLYTACEIVFVSLFFVVRLIIGTYYLMMVLYRRENDLEFRVVTIVIYIISLLFILQIILLIKRRYLQYRTNLARNVKIN